MAIEESARCTDRWSEMETAEDSTTAMKYGKVLKERWNEMENMALCVLLLGEQDHSKAIVSEAYALYKSFFDSAVANANTSSPSAVSISTHLRWNPDNLKALLAACLREGAKMVGMEMPITAWSKPFKLEVWQILRATKHIEPFLLRLPSHRVFTTPKEVGVIGAARLVTAHLNRVCGALGFDKQDQAMCCEMAERMMETTNTSRRPSTLAGLIAWIYCLVKGVPVNKQVLVKNSATRKALHYAFIDIQSNLPAIIPAHFGHPDAWLHKIYSP